MDAQAGAGRAGALDGVSEDPPHDYEVRRAQLRRDSLFLRLKGKTTGEVRIKFAIPDRTFRELERVMKVMVPHLELPGESEGKLR